MDASWLPPRRVWMCPRSLVHLACTGCVASVCFAHLAGAAFVCRCGRFFILAKTHPSIAPAPRMHRPEATMASIHASSVSQAGETPRPAATSRATRHTKRAWYKSALFCQRHKSGPARHSALHRLLLSSNLSPGSQPCSTAAARRRGTPCPRQRSTCTPPPRQVSRVPQRRRRSTRAPPPPRVGNSPALHHGR